MKIDLAGKKNRGLTLGINEFAGYLAVGLMAFLAGYLAATYSDWKQLLLEQQFLLLAPEFYRKSGCVAQTNYSGVVKYVQN